MTVMVPLVPSTSRVVPSGRLVACPTPSTAEIPYSRATIAAWDSGPPVPAIHAVRPCRRRLPRPLPDHRPGPARRRAEGTAQKIDRARAATTLRTLSYAGVENTRRGPDSGRSIRLNTEPRSLRPPAPSAFLGEVARERQHEPAKKAPAGGGRLDLVDKVAQPRYGGTFLATHVSHL